MVHDHWQLMECVGTEWEIYWCKDTRRYFAVRLNRGNDEVIGPAMTRADLKEAIKGRGN